MPGGFEEMRDIMALVERFAASAERSVPEGGTAFAVPRGLPAAPAKSPHGDLRGPAGLEEPSRGAADGLPDAGEDAEQLAREATLLADLGDLVFKLRAHTEQDDGERSLGFEDGMQRAADMLENLMRRHGTPAGTAGDPPGGNGFPAEAQPRAGGDALPLPARGHGGSPDRPGH